MNMSARCRWRPDSNIATAEKRATTATKGNNFCQGSEVGRLEGAEANILIRNEVREQATLDKGSPVRWAFGQQANHCCRLYGAGAHTCHATDAEHVRSLG